jgi:chromosome segregation protein
VAEHVAQTANEVDATLARHDQSRAKYSENLRLVALADEQIAALESEVLQAHADSERLRQRLAELVQTRELHAVELDRSQTNEAELMADSERHRSLLASAEHRLAEVRRNLGRANLLVRQTDAQLARVRERIAVLSELEGRLEGLDGGVQEILRLAREEPSHHLGDVRGVVADLFHVDVDSAPLVEVALGERAQYIVLASTSTLLEWLDAQPLRVAGRVGFLGIEGRHSLAALDHVELSAEPGVMGRADRFVESAPEYQVLARRLLGRTWLVDRLATARRLAQSIGRGLEFVTSDGELIAADGAIVVGPRQAATGVLSRRSELRSCHGKADALDQELAVQNELHTQLDQERCRQEELVATSVAAYATAAGKLSECRGKTAAAAVQLDRVVEDERRTTSELHACHDRIVAVRAEVEKHNDNRDSARTLVSQLELALAESTAALSALRQKQAEAQGALTARTVAAARAEQRVEMLRQQMAQFERSRQDREQLLEETRERLAHCEGQIADLDKSIHAGQQRLAELFTTKDELAAMLATYSAADNELRCRRQELLDRVRTERQQLGALQSQLHKMEVAVARLRHERQTLCDRMHDDYGINLEEVATRSEPETGSEQQEPTDSPPAPSPLPAALNRDAAEREIAELRDKINNIGAINLEALDELEQLEARFEKLSNQYRDLVDAKASLERITQRINADSRQLFLTTLETIRVHFQELFRRLFGGGEADIVVDEADDVLECGIEIVGRPPGKEACSISLLSGGEKTLTCVALLLAVFRSKPSPFCILDEVDAALDEANIGRFTAVLREFLSFTQFIVITHSKKTMAGANTLYGVTMEESGVSKRVCVRFEDVSEEGQILPTAMVRTTAPASPADGDPAPQKQAA